MKKERILKGKRLKFAEEYVKCNNGNTAAIAAGYSKKTAGVQASQLIKDDLIKKYVEEHRIVAAAEIGVTPDWWIVKQKEVVERCMQDVSPVIDRKGVPIETTNKEGEEVPAYIFNAMGANSGLTNIGKYLGIFKEGNTDGKFTININSAKKKSSS